MGGKGPFEEKENKESLIAASCKQKVKLLRRKKKKKKKVFVATKKRNRHRDVHLQRKKTSAM